jgi:LPXTG-motif cell wall-anchored protein
MSHRREEDECFGLPGGNVILGILIGLAIIFVGARELLGWTTDVGPYAAILLGLLFIAGGFYGMSRRKK